MDAQAEKTFPAERICNYQGSFARLQCKQPCCDELFDAGPYVEGARERARRGDGCVLLLELGVGEMTPGIIAFPFWSMAAKLPDAHLLSVNISSGSAPLQLGSKAEAVQADLGALLSAARAGGEERKRRLGSYYSVIQQRVNEMLS